MSDRAFVEKSSAVVVDAKACGGEIAAMHAIVSAVDTIAGLANRLAKRLNVVEIFMAFSIVCV